MPSKKRKKTANPTKHCSNAVCNGDLLVIDPSTGATGDAGWAEFKAGALWEWGVLEIAAQKNPYHRFQTIRELLRSEFTNNYHVLVMELLKGRYAKLSLKQSMAVFAACTDWGNIVLITPRMWQAVADRLGGHIKRDDIDAVYIGYTALAFAEGYDSSWEREAQEDFLQKLATELNWRLGPWD
jgi:hypothetical protein